MFSLLNWCQANIHWNETVPTTGPSGWACLSFWIGRCRDVYLTAASDGGLTRKVPWAVSITVVSWIDAFQRSSQLELRSTVFTLYPLCFSSRANMCQSLSAIVLLCFVLIVQGQPSSYTSTHTSGSGSSTSSASAVASTGDGTSKESASTTVTSYATAETFGCTKDLKVTFFHIQSMNCFARPIWRKQSCRSSRNSLVTKLSRFPMTVILVKCITVRSIKCMGTISWLSVTLHQQRFVAICVVPWVIATVGGESTVMEGAISIESILEAGTTPILLEGTSESVNLVFCYLKLTTWSDGTVVHSSANSFVVLILNRRNDLTLEFVAGWSHNETKCVRRIEKSWM